MPEIFFSESGVDKNDGLRENTPIHSWERYLKLKTGNDRIIILGDAENHKEAPKGDKKEGGIAAKPPPWHWAGLASCNVLCRVQSLKAN